MRIFWKGRHNCLYPCFISLKSYDPVKYSVVALGEEISMYVGKFEFYCINHRISVDDASSHLMMLSHRLITEVR